MEIQKLFLLPLIAALIITSSIPALAASVNSGITVKTLVYPSLEYDNVGKFSEGLASAKKGNKYGFINSKGNEVITLQYDFVEKFSEGLAAVRKSGKWGFIDKDNNIVIEFEYGEVGNFSDGLARIKKDGKWGYIDKTGKIIIQPIYSGANDFKEGLAAVYNGTVFKRNLPKYITGTNPNQYDFSVVYKDNDGKWGFIDKTGKEVIPFEYDDINGYSDEYSGYSGGFVEGFATMCKDMKWGYIDRSGETVIPFIYDETGHFSEGLAYVVTKRNAKMYNVKTGIVNGSFVFENNYDAYYIDKTGEIIITVEKIEPVMKSSWDGSITHSTVHAAPFSNGLACINVNTIPVFSGQGTFKFIDKSGNSVLEVSATQYEGGVGSFDENGLAWVRIGNVKTSVFWYGCIDKIGKEVIPPIYSTLNDFNEGLAAVRKDGKWGILQVDGSGK